MDGYKHFIRTDQAGVIIHGFSSAFEEPQEGDNLISEDGPRHFHQAWPDLRNERGQFCYKWLNGKREERTLAELDAEWAARPSEPPSEIDRLKAENAALQQQVAQTNNDLVGFQNFIFEKFPEIA